MTRRDWPDVELTGGDWRFDPFTRVLRWVPTDPAAEIADAFDEPFEEPLRPGGRPRAEIKHGTHSGATLHYRRGETACDSCTAAEADYKMQRAKRRHQEGDPRYTCECGNYKSRVAVRCAPCAVTFRWANYQRSAA